MKHVEDIRKSLLKDVDELRSKNDILTQNHDKLTNDLDNALKAQHLAEQQLKEIKLQRDDFQ